MRTLMLCFTLALAGCDCGGVVAGEDGGTGGDDGGPTSSDDGGTQSGGDGGMTADGGQESPAFATQISAGAIHTCEVRTDHSIWCWGFGNNGQLGTFDPLGPDIESGTPLKIPSALGWRQVSSGAVFSCAIRDDGTLWCWGVFGSSFMVRPTPVQIGTAGDWTHISAGGANVGNSFACGLRADGSLWCFGDNTQGQLGDGTSMNSGDTPVQVQPGSTWTQVDVASAHACATKSDGTAWCWGSNVSRQLGDGTTTDRNAPVQVGTGTDFTKIAAGEGVSCGLRGAGELWCWGSGVSNMPGPTQFAPGKTFTELTAGGAVCAIDPDKSLWCLGTNQFGQVGNGTTTYLERMPHQVGAEKDWVQVSAGAGHTCGIREGGTRWCWGWNGAGQIGMGRTARKRLPWRVGAESDWETVVTDKWLSACGLKKDGSLWCWGLRANADVAASQIPESDVPVRVGTETGWKNLRVGGAMRCAMKADDTLWCWLYVDELNGLVKVPTQFGTAKWRDVAIGPSHVCGVQMDGTLWCWGRNDDFELGDGTTVDKKAPTQIGSETTWASVTAGRDHTCAVRMDGSGWCWGRNLDGETGAPSKASWVHEPEQISGTWTRITAGNDHTCGVQTDATLWCWGESSGHRLGVEDPSDPRLPTQVGSAADWVTVSAGSIHTCATRSDGALWCFGFNSDGQLGISSEILPAFSLPAQVAAGTSWKTVSCGGGSTLALTDDGRLFGWGLNNRGQLGDDDGWMTVPTAVAP